MFGDETVAVLLLSSGLRSDPPFHPFLSSMVSNRLAVKRERYLAPRQAKTPGHSSGSSNAKSKGQNNISANFQRLFWIILFGLTCHGYHGNAIHIMCEDVLLKATMLLWTGLNVPAWSLEPEYHYSPERSLCAVFACMSACLQVVWVCIVVLKCVWVYSTLL